MYRRNYGVPYICIYKMMEIIYINRSVKTVILKVGLSGKETIRVEVRRLKSGQLKQTAGLFFSSKGELIQYIHIHVMIYINSGLFFYL